MKHLPFILWFFLPAPLLAQEPQTDPIVLPHPATGEPGVWTPRWLQRAHLQTEADLQLCLKTSELLNEQLSTRNAEAGELREAAVELKLSHAKLQESAAAAALSADIYREKAHRRLVWAISSTSVVGVALLTAVLVGAL